MARGLSVVFAVGCFAACLAGCLRASTGPFDDPAQLGDPSVPRCLDDTGCDPGDVCTRSAVCLPPDQVRAVHVTWTVSGAPASATSCAAAPDLRIDLDGASGPGRVSFAPVPCAEGKFSVDRLPVWFDRVALGRESGDSPQEGTIDAVTGEAALDLPY